MTTQNFKCQFLEMAQQLVSFSIYHMYGDTIGTLNVYSGNELVFNVSGNQGLYWIRAMETIYLRNNVSLIWFASQNITTDVR